MKNILEHGMEQALTGPVNGGHGDTIRSHMENCICRYAAPYQNLCARPRIAKVKHPQWNYTKLQTMMEEWKMKQTVITFQEAKQKQEKITMLTAYDYSTAPYPLGRGTSTLLVGDSLGMVMLGI